MFRHLLTSLKSTTLIAVRRTRAAAISEYRDDPSTPPPQPQPSTLISDVTVGRSVDCPTSATQARMHAITQEQEQARLDFLLFIHVRTVGSGFVVPFVVVVLD